MGENTSGKNLQLRCKGPFVVTLTFPIALKVDRIKARVHHSHIHKASTKEVQKAEQWTVEGPDMPREALKANPN